MSLEKELNTFNHHLLCLQLEIKALLPGPSETTGEIKDRGCGDGENNEIKEFLVTKAASLSLLMERLREDYDTLVRHFTEEHKNALEILNDCSEVNEPIKEDEVDVQEMDHKTESMETVHSLEPSIQEEQQMCSSIVNLDDTRGIFTEESKLDVTLPPNALNAVDINDDSVLAATFMGNGSETEASASCDIVEPEKQEIISGHFIANCDDHEEKRSEIESIEMEMESTSGSTSTCVLDEDHLTTLAGVGKSEELEEVDEKFVMHVGLMLPDNNDYSVTEIGAVSRDDKSVQCLDECLVKSSNETASKSSRSFNLPSLSFINVVILILFFLYIVISVWALLGHMLPHKSLCYNYRDSMPPGRFESILLGLNEDVKRLGGTLRTVEKIMVEMEGVGAV